MLVPVVRKIMDNKKCFVERVFPVEGIWDVKIGDFVEPFGRLGSCVFSQNKMLLPNDFKPRDVKGTEKFFYVDTLLGKSKKEKIFAPYDGTLKELDDKKFVYEENPRKYFLLSGVWGTVKSFYGKSSVLVETQSKDISFAFSTEFHSSGELVVFPNPSDILKKSYLENFVKGIKGKIIYIGNHVGLEVVKRAYELGAAAVVAGSAHTDALDFSNKNGFSFGVFSGFGNIRTPEEIYKYLSSVSYRYVFFEGAKNLLRIPVREEDLSASDKKGKTSDMDIFDPNYIKNIEPGMRVQALQRPYFGWFGVVDRVSESSIFVRFGSDEKTVEIRLPNFVIIE